MNMNGTAPLSAFQAYKNSPVVKKNKSVVSTSAKKKSKKDKKARLSLDELRLQVVAQKTPPSTGKPAKYNPKMTPEEKKLNKLALEHKKKERKKEALKPPKKYIMSPNLHVPKKSPDPSPGNWDVSFGNGQGQSQSHKKRKFNDSFENPVQKKSKQKVPRYFQEPIEVTQEHTSSVTPNLKKKFENPSKKKSQLKILQNFQKSIEVTQEQTSFVVPNLRKESNFLKANGSREPELDPVVAEGESSDEEIPILIEVKKNVQTVELDGDHEETELVTNEAAAGNISRVHLDQDNESSIDKGKELLENIVAPMKLHTFLKDFWEKTPVVIKRKKPDYFSQLDLTSESLDAMLRKNHIRYTKNIDITTYRDGKRETLNPPGRATPAEVWEFYNEGASVRWINPQTFSSRLWLFCATLQEYFGCFVGANLYLTPPGTQGFAPHYDDIEAFILQLEGSKHWRLYHPRSDGEVLPRYSSGNFDRAEVGAPFMEVTLHAGDVLYFPRGVIHEAVADDTHSLHATLSVYQRNAWADLLEKMIPAALSAAIADDVRLRRGLPIGFLSYAGAAHADSTAPERAAFARTAAELTKAVLERIDVDAAADQMGLRFIQDALPPVLTEQERQCSMAEDGERMIKDGLVVNSWAMDKRTKVKLVRAHCVRLVYELGNPKVYYNLDNTREYHEEEPGFFEIAPEMVPCVKKLIDSYPNFIAINSLPLGSMEEKVQLVGEFWMKGLLLTEKPVGEDNEEGSDSDEDDEISSDADCSE